MLFIRSVLSLVLWPCNDVEHTSSEGNDDHTQEVNEESLRVIFCIGPVKYTLTHLVHIIYVTHFSIG